MASTKNAVVLPQVFIVRNKHLQFVRHQQIAQSNNPGLHLLFVKRFFENPATKGNCGGRFSGNIFPCCSDGE
jgi:hypothetical protein